MALTGAAAQILGEGRSYRRYEDLVAQLEACYGSQDQRTIHRVQLQALRRLGKQTIKEMYLEVKRLLPLAYPDPYSELGESMAMEVFIKSLDDNDLELKIRDKMPETLDSAYQMALRFEANKRSMASRSHWQEEYKDSRRRVRAVDDHHLSLLQLEYSL